MSLGKESLTLRGAEMVLQKCKVRSKTAQLIPTKKAEIVMWRCVRVVTHEDTRIYLVRSLDNVREFSRCDYVTFMLVILKYR